MTRSVVAPPRQDDFLCTRCCWLLTAFLGLLLLTLALLYGLGAFGGRPAAGAAVDARVANGSVVPTINIAPPRPVPSDRRVAGPVVTSYTPNGNVSNGNLQPHSVPAVVYVAP